MRLRIVFSTILLAILFSLLILRSDGYFPFNKNQNESLLLLAIVAHVMCFTILLFLFFSKKVYLSRLLVFIQKRLNILVILTSSALILISVFLLYKNYKIYSDSYSFNLQIVVLISITSLIFIISSLALKRARLAIASLFTSSFLLSIIPIAYFPIISKIGDLIPIIQKQNEAFLAGQNIYQYFLLDNGVLTQAVRQPGTSLSYLPAYLLNIDLRWMGVLFTFLTCIILIKLAYKKLSEIKFDQKFLVLFFLLSLILLSPYRLNRLDVYEPVFWFLITLSIYLLRTKKPAIASIVWGLGIFTQVWFWLFSPFFGYYIYKKNGFKSSLKYAGLVILFGVLPLALFILKDPAEYYKNVFGYYGNLVVINEFNTSSFYLTPLFLKAGLKGVLTPLQGIFVLSSFILFLKLKKTLRNFVMCLILAFFVFIQFNSLTWNYMYMNLILFMIIYIILNLKEK